MSTYPTDPAATAGPNRDGSQSLARESKFGQAWAFATTVAAMVAVDALNAVDTGDMPVWLAGTVTAAVGSAVGLLTAYITRNRTTRPRAS